MMHHSPPRLARRMLRWFVQAHFLEEVEGDLDELFQQRVHQAGLHRARLYYWLDVWQTFRPYPVMRRPSQLAHELMNGVFIRLAWRSLRGHKRYSALNVAGLCVGMLAFLLIVQFVAFEQSYDTFHTNANRIYRVAFDWGETDYRGVNSSVYASSVPAMGPALQQHMPGVQLFTRFVHVRTVKPQSVIMAHQGSKVIYQATAENGFYADENFLRVFSFPIQYGDQRALAKPGNVVLTRRFAHTIFGNLPDETIVGRLLAIDTGEKETQVVAAIINDVPANSHLHFDFLLSYATINSDRLEDNKGWSQFYTYILANENTSHESLTAHITPVLESLYGKESRVSIFLQPLRSIYLTSHLRDEPGHTGSEQQLSLLMLMAYGILAIAWFNYINLFLARAMSRTGEVGVKKVLGSTRVQLVVQFFTESLVLIGAGSLITAVLFAAAQPYVAAWLGGNATWLLLGDRSWVTLLGVVSLAGCVVMGLYPAVVLSANKPVHVWASRTNGRHAWGKFGLVYVQFAVSFVMMAGTLIVARQITYMRTADLGITLNNRIALHGPTTADSASVHAAQVLAARLREYPFIENVSFSSVVPGKAITSSGGVQRVMGPELPGNNVLYLQADENYTATFGIQLLAGRNFSPSRTGERLSVLINEAARQTLKFESPEEALHHRIHWQRSEYEIVGVIANYNHRFLKEQCEPLIIQYHPHAAGFMTLQVSDGARAAALPLARKEMHALFPDVPFEPEDLATAYDNQYADVDQFKTATMAFAGLAVVMACLGLFAVSWYVAEGRVREMAVRRVFGASVGRVAFTLSRTYIFIVLSSCAAGALVTIAIMRQWLQNFAFAISLQSFDFLVPGLFLLLFAIVTVSYHSIRVSRRSPVRSLTNP